jgi:glycyl-tRNA synthetase
VEHDRLQPLEAFTPRLATLTFQEQFGSMLDKVRRLEQLTPWVAARLGLSAQETATAVRAASLCKSDLATSMVVEMTSLQGIMGREYALSSGESPAVAQAIFEHYLPRSSGDRRPASLPGLALGLANRLDSIAGLFAVGLEPSGSADPFGLRRDALGIVQNLAEAGLSFSVRAGVAEAARLLPLAATQEAQDKAVAFIAGRLENWLRDEGYPYDVVQAVLAERGDDPAVARQTVAALAQAVAQPDWPAVLTAYARCKRIVESCRSSTRWMWRSILSRPRRRCWLHFRLWRRRCRRPAMCTRSMLPCTRWLGRSTPSSTRCWSWPRTKSCVKRGWALCSTSPRCRMGLPIWRCYRDSRQRTAGTEGNSSIGDGSALVLVWPR